MAVCDYIAGNRAELLSAINAACRKAGRDPEEIAIVCVTKYADALQTKSAIEAGFKNIGESRLGAAQEKQSNVKTAGVKWHLIGPLQKNKARDAVKVFDLIQSVDSVEIARALDRAAEAQKLRQDILLQVNVSGERQKHGFVPEEVKEAADKITALRHLSIKGLMAMAPYSEEAEETRPFFKSASALFAGLRALGDPRIDMSILSLGMSRDFAVAIEEGSNMVRVGTMIFEEHHA